MEFEEFVATRLVMLLRYATVLTCDPHLAEDIVQEVLARAQGRWARIVHADYPERYVKRMVTNEFLSWRRRRAARVVPLSLPALDQVAGSTPDPAVQRDERDALLAQVAALPPRQRAVIALRYYEDMPDAEIAEILGCGRATVRSHASRALAALQTALAPRPADEQELTHGRRKAAIRPAASE